MKFEDKMWFLVKICAGILVAFIVIMFLMAVMSKMKFNKYHLEKFQKSEVLKEYFGKIKKAEAGDWELVEEYAEDKFVLQFIIYDENNEQHQIGVIENNNSTIIYGYIINGRAIFEDDNKIDES